MLKGRILIFGILEWHERHQRPQEIALALSALGWKVAYISPNLQENHFQGYSIIEEVNPNLILVRISVPDSAPNPYVGKPNKNQEVSFSLNLNKFCRENAFESAIFIMQIPFWWYFLKNESNFIMYDCMDYHKGFEIHDSNAHDIEVEAINKVDRLITSSTFLENLYKDKKPILIRNGCVPTNFHINYDSIDKNTLNIGYFGVIDKWFDVNLVKKLAEEIPNIKIHLIGNVSKKILKEISLYDNIIIYGEIPHSELDTLSNIFDVSMIPFLITDLTKATDPVKIYEYAAKGLFTFATNLPELVEVPDYIVYRANSHTDFIDALRAYLENSKSQKEVRELRRDWSMNNTWIKRAEIFEKIIIERSSQHLVAIISYNNSQSLSELIESVKRNCGGYSKILVIDNSDERNESDKVKTCVSNHPNTILIRPGRNIGFGAACNLALDFALKNNYKYATLLNDDVLFEMDYISRVESHFDANHNLQLIGPLTNSIGNEARVNYVENSLQDKKYYFSTLLGLSRGQVLNVERIAFFAVTFRIETIKEIGFLDESFGIGYFEDDDFCLRVKSKNYDIGIALDCYITHAHSMSFDKLGGEKRLELFDNNRKIFESKHGPWIPHKFKKDHLNIGDITKHLF